MQQEQQFVEEASVEVCVPEMQPDSQDEEIVPCLTEEDFRAAKRLCKRLRRNDPVRQRVEALLSGAHPPFSATLTHFQVLRSRFGFNWRQAELAAWALGRVPLTLTQHEAAAEVLERIVPILDWPDKSVRIGQGILRTLLTSFLLCGIGVIISSISVRAPEDLLGLLIGGVFVALLASIPLAVLMIPVSSVIEDAHLNQVRAATVETLGRLCEPTSAGALAYAALLGRSAGYQKVRRIALRALPSVLSRLTLEHYGQLPAHSVPHLCALLYNSEEPLALLTLEALGKVGDGSAVRSVQRMAERGRTENLREAAAGILPILEQRREQENAPKILLRATTAPAAPADTLLRPASGTSEADPQQLLRASAQTAPPSS